MSDEEDIVVRLRNAPWTTADDCNAAADEIETLRTRVKELEGIIDTSHHESTDP